MLCVNDCRNAIFFWRDASFTGTCVEIKEENFVCLCEEGYRTRNVLDQPVCESASTTLWLYSIVIFGGIVALALSLYHRQRQKNLLNSTGIPFEKYTLQDINRSRMYLAGAVLGLVFSVHFSLLFFDVLTFTQSLPLFAADHAIISELGLVSVETWISLLPRSLLKADTLAFRICGYCQNAKHLWVLSVPVTTSYVVGAAIGFFGDPITCRYIIQITVTIQIFYSIIVIDIVAYSLLHVMKSAKKRTSLVTRMGGEKEMRMYNDVMKRLRWRALGANCIIFFFIGTSVFSVFTPLGHRSPLLTYVFTHGFGPCLWVIFSVIILAPKSNKQVVPTPGNTDNSLISANRATGLFSFYPNNSVIRVAGLTLASLNSPRGTFALQNPIRKSRILPVSNAKSDVISSPRGTFSMQNSAQKGEILPILSGMPGLSSPRGTFTMKNPMYVAHTQKQISPVLPISHVNSNLNSDAPRGAFVMQIPLRGGRLNSLPSLAPIVVKAV